MAVNTKVNYLLAVFAVIATTLTAEVARADQDMPPVPRPGLPWGAVPPCSTNNVPEPCIHNWTSSNAPQKRALAVFFEQKRCTDGHGHTVLNVSPFDNSLACVALDYLNKDDLLPYHKTSHNGGYYDDIPVNTPNGDIAVGLQCTLPTCGGGGHGTNEDVSNTAGDIFIQTNNTISHAKNNDASGPGLRVNVGCETYPGQTINFAYQNGAEVLEDTRVFVDSRVTQVGKLEGHVGDLEWSGQRWDSTHNTGLCPDDADDKYTLGTDAWFFARHQFPLKFSLTQNHMSGGLLTLVHSELGDNAGNCHVEHEYYTREMGKVRHESFYNSDISDCWKMTDLPDDCPTGSTLDFPREPGTWVMYHCIVMLYSVGQSGTPDDNPLKARQILQQSNMSSALWGIPPSDLPVPNLVTPSCVVTGYAGPITIKGSFPPNPNWWFGDSANQTGNLTVMAGQGHHQGISTHSINLTDGSQSATFTVTDWSDQGPLQLGDNALALFDGVSTSNNAVHLTVQSTSCPLHRQRGHAKH